MSQPVICPACRKPNSPSARFCQHCGHDVVLNNAGPRYFLTRVIKEGGQGAVYEARGEDGAIYAVKEMLDHFTDPRERADAVARFAAEAETLRRLTDPRIPRVYASFNDEGRHYLVMEFIRGEDLDEIVAREGAQPEARVLAWADELCDVLGHLHARGVVYRDMKPSNVMLEQPGGTLKLIDFGIAKVFQPQARGTQIGTPGYAPPEQYQGLATTVSDVYALGATLHHLLSGRDPQQHPPFAYPPLRALVPGISARTEAAVARALQMRQEDRFQSVEELRAALLPAPAGQVLAPAAVAAAPVGQVLMPGPAPAPVPSTSPPAAASPAGLSPAAPLPAAAAGRPAAPPPAVASAAASGGAKAAAPAARPAPTVPIMAPTPGAAPAPGAAPVRAPRGRGVPLVLGVVLLILAAGAAGFFLLVPAWTSTPAATSTAQVLIARPFVARDIELVVPTGSDEAAVNRAFAAAFLQLARLDCGCEPQIQPGTLVYLTGAAPQELSSGPDGTRYRASLQATLLVPEQ